MAKVNQEIKCSRYDLPIGIVSTAAGDTRASYFPTHLEALVNLEEKVEVYFKHKDIDIYSVSLGEFKDKDDTVFKNFKFRDKYTGEVAILSVLNNTTKQKEEFMVIKSTSYNSDHKLLFVGEDYWLYLEKFLGLKRPENISAMHRDHVLSKVLSYPFSYLAHILSNSYYDDYFYIMNENISKILLENKNNKNFNNKLNIAVSDKYTLNDILRITLFK